MVTPVRATLQLQLHYFCPRHFYNVPALSRKVQRPVKGHPWRSFCIIPLMRSFFGQNFISCIWDTLYQSNERKADSPQSTSRQWKKAQVSHCCSADVWTCWPKRQLYNNQKMAQLVLFSTAWLWVRVTIPESTHLHQHQNLISIVITES